jgi:hypothetical protein
MTDYNHVEHFFDSFCLELAFSWISSGTNWTDSSSWSNRTAKLARLLNSNWTDFSSWSNQTARLARLLNSNYEAQTWSAVHLVLQVPTGPTFPPGPTDRLGWLGSSTPTGPTLLPGPTDRLGWLGSSTPTWPAFELPHDSWTASHCSVLFSTVLSCGLQHLVWGVLAWTAKRLRVLTLAEAWLLSRYRGNVNPQRAWIRANVWLLRNTPQYGTTHVLKINVSE